MLLSLRKNGLTSLFKEVRVFKVVHCTPHFGEHPGDHNHQDFPKSTAIQMGGVLQYKWEAYCDTNGRSTESIPFPQSLGAPKVLQYKLEAYCNTCRLEVYCDTFLRSGGGWGFWHSSDISITMLLQQYALLLAESSIYTTNVYHETASICIPNPILLQKH